MSDFIAYHSAEVMGHEYQHRPGDDFGFLSRKPRSYLESAIGNRVWVITGARGPDRRMVYRLAGFYTPSDVDDDDEDYLVVWGERGIHLTEPIEVTSLPWFSRLLQEQNRFSYGFSRIRDARIVDELQKALDAHVGASVSEQLDGVSQVGFVSPDEVVSGGPLVEGSVCRITVNAYERNTEARRRCIAAHGSACCICGFSFGAVFGAEAAGYIHVHHIRPLSEIEDEYVVDPVRDLRPVCPNCHAVLHLGGRCRTIDEVRHLLEQQGTA